MEETSRPCHNGTGAMPGTDRPVMLFDGACGFCRIWIDYWKGVAGDAVEFAPWQAAAAEHPQVSEEDCRRAVQLVMPSGEVLSGAHAVFRTLAHDRSLRWWLVLYERLPAFPTIAEAAYRLIAAHRDFCYHATVLLFGRRVQPLHYGAVERLFSAILGLIWMVAFVSFGVQAAGLIGSHGVLPASHYLTRLTRAFGGAAWRVAPTVFWLGSGDAAIRAVWIAGTVCGLMALCGVFRRASLAAAFVLYLSLVSVAQEFLSYQWDYLLLETGFLAILLGYSPVVVWLYRWLLFRLMFLSGAVKLLSGDRTWLHLDALRYHYQTQPLPTPLAWYAQQLPVWAQKASCFLVLFTELAIPFLVLGPRRARRIAAVWLVGLQWLIILTGNYAFFNWLAIALCLFLVDDEWLARIVLRGRFERLARPVPTRRRLAWPVAVILFFLTLSLVMETLHGWVPAAARTAVATAAPFGIANSYGLFAVMTTTRPEIVIEGSNDGVNWRAYEFRHKPGPLDRPPPWVAPHQPRLDWQMWFAALGSSRENPWFLNLLARLLEGEPEVLRLMGGNPFPGRPPTYIRARLYDYRFTTWGSRQWWKRTLLGYYLPAVRLEDLRPAIWDRAVSR